MIGAYVRRQAYTDCYAVFVPGVTTLAEFVEAFYTTRLFKLERWLLARALNLPATDEQALRLAQGACDRYSAWRVEQRSNDEILVEFGPTRSWLCAKPAAGSAPGTTLLFGSVVVPTRPDGGFGLAFHALGGFHRLYARLLLAAAARRVIALRRASRAA